MSRVSRVILYFRLLIEFFQYDVMQSLFGFSGVRRCLRHPASNRADGNPELVSLICDSVSRVIPFYWKRAMCLQRSVVTARVLRAYGAPAELVIGYRSVPFLAHAWVEVGGRIVNDSPAFPSRLQVLERL